MPRRKPSPSLEVRFEVRKATFDDGWLIERVEYQIYTWTTPKGGPYRREEGEAREIMGFMYDEGLAHWFAELLKIRLAMEGGDA